jgi:hypothetical protein
LYTCSQTKQAKKSTLAESDKSQGAWGTASPI